MGRIHAVGSARPFQFRESLTPNTFGHYARAYLLSTPFIPADLLEAWKAVTQQALQLVEACCERAGAVKAIRLHGDFHLGQVLVTGNDFIIKDLEGEPGRS